MSSPFVPLVEVLRGDVVESIHHGLLVVADPDGRVVESRGDPAHRVVLRSAGKPFQAAHFVASGAAEALGVTDAELAVAVGSHGGTPEHVAQVASLMRKGGVEERMLRCGVHPPFDRAAKLLARRTGPTVLQNNCSGKHAAMLAGSIHLGLPLDTYLDPAHPWQQGIARLLADAAGVLPAELATVTDGCSAPSFVVPAAAAARALARLAAGDGPLARVWRASTSQPLMIAGRGRLETDIMESAPGRAFAKSGAEGVYALALRTDDGPLGVLVKVGDGDDARARPALGIALASRLLALEPAQRQRLWADHVPEVATLLGRPAGAIRCLVPVGPG